MELNTRGRYAVTAMADLALNAGDAPVNSRDIAERRAIPHAYLDQIIADLRRSGLIASVRGRSGGYRLGADAKDITVASILRAVGEGMEMTRCGVLAVEGCQAGVKCLTHDLWRGLSSLIETYLEDVTLADIADGRLPHTSSVKAAPDADRTGRREVASG